MVHTYEIEGMHCDACVQKLTKALSAVNSVRNVKVTLNPPEAVVETDTHVPGKVFEDAVKKVGAYSLKEKSVHHSSPVGDSEEQQSLMPLFIIVGYLIGGVLLRATITDDYSLHSMMETFMGGFFIIFSLFKMIDLQGFAEAYGTYDIIGKRFGAYALAYPFIELGLGVAYVTHFAPIVTNMGTAGLMAIGSIGVAQALIQKRKIQCACLGTVLQLPMTKVTLVEDVLMGVMAVVMLFIQ